MRKNINSAQGFTFIEVLIGAIILALISLGITAVFRQYSNSELHVTRTLDNVMDGNNVINRITEELKYAERVNPPTAGGRELTFNYFQEAINRRIFMRDTNIFLNNGGGDILIAENVSDIQFRIIDSDNQIVSIIATIHNSDRVADFQINTTVKLMNSQ